MSKYIDADRLRVRIDKLYCEYKNKFHQCEDQYYLGLIDGLDMAVRVLDFIEEPEEESDLQDAEVVLSGHALHTDVTKWADGYKLKIRIYDDN